MKIDYKLLFLLSIAICAGCSNSSSSSNTSSISNVQGLDLTGNWRIAGIECYDSELNELTAVGLVSSDSSVSTTTINGNLLTSTTIGTNSCRIDMNNSILANLTGGDAEGGYGTGTFGEAVVSTLNGLSCESSLSFTMAEGSVTPSVFSNTYLDGQTVASRTFEFIINPPYLAFTSIIQVVNRPTDICFLIYEKI